MSGIKLYTDTSIIFFVQILYSSGTSIRKLSSHNAFQSTTGPLRTKYMYYLLVVYSALALLFNSTTIPPTEKKRSMWALISLQFCEILLSLLSIILFMTKLKTLTLYKIAIKELDFIIISYKKN